MMAELVARGPIACTVAVTEQFEQYSSGVFNDTTGATVHSTHMIMYCVIVHLCTHNYMCVLLSRQFIKIIYLLCIADTKLYTGQVRLLWLKKSVKSSQLKLPAFTCIFFLIVLLEWFPKM